MKNLILIRDFFPFRLISAHVKYNFFGLIYWVVLFGIAGGQLGSFFGVPFLFYAPEFLGEVSFMSFYLLGISIGGFIMMFNAYSYSKLGPRFPFLLVVSTPFFRFFINNSLIPLSFTLFYIWNTSFFLSEEELYTSASIFMFMLGFLAGILTFIVLSMTYFFQIRRNKDVDDDLENDSNQGPFISFQGKRNEKWFNYFRLETKRPIFYLGKRFKIYRSRPTSHLDREVVEQIYAENRIYVFLFEFTTLIAFIGMGFFKDVKYFDIPAAMSIVTLMSILNLIFNTLKTWFHRWAYFFIIVGFSTATYLSIHSHFFQYDSFFLGFNYDKEQRTPYAISSIKKGYNDTLGIEKSLQEAIDMLDQWKAKQADEKPKLILVNSSGGGSRSALWTFEVLKELDRRSQNEFSNATHLIAGASGGMIGAAFYRQLILEEKLGEIESRLANRYSSLIASDFLNKLSFSFSTSDIFVRAQQFEYDDYSYTLERGIAFEEQLNEKLENKLNRKLAYYTPYEQDASIPRMLFSPIVVEDGRRMLIGSNSFQYLLRKSELDNFEFIDIYNFFQNQKISDLRFTSVLRANATFPYIMPMITLPTEPKVHLMDAGIRDNFGGKLTFQFIQALKTWIKENTSGVVIVEIRDTKRILNDEVFEKTSLLDKIFLPMSNLNVNFTRHQDYDIELMYGLLKEAVSFPLDIISFNLTLERKKRVSLSWRLTEREKNTVKEALFEEENLGSFSKLSKLMYWQ